MFYHCDKQKIIARETIQESLQKLIALEGNFNKYQAVQSIYYSLKRVFINLSFKKIAILITFEKPSYLFSFPFNTA